MSEKTSKDREEIEFTGKRIRHYSKLGFDDVLSRLQARVGKITIENVVELGKTREEFEEKIQQFIGESGFMLFSEIDHGHRIAPFGVKRRSFCLKHPNGQKRKAVQNRESEAGKLVKDTSSTSEQS
jgi:hypothetical protein